MGTTIAVRTSATALNIRTVTISEPSQTEAEIKGSAGNVHALAIDNTLNTAAATYFKFYDDLTPTPGTDDPEMILYCPAGASYTLVAQEPLVYATGIEVAAVTTGGTAGVVPPTEATEIVVTTT